MVGITNMTIDDISLVMFVVPLAIAILFSVLALVAKGREQSQAESFSSPLIVFLSCLLSSISWFIFGLTWPALATTEMFVAVGYLWYALGVIFAILTLYTGLKMMGDIFNEKQPRLVLKMDED